MDRFALPHPLEPAGLLSRRAFLQRLSYASAAAGCLSLQRAIAQNSQDRPDLDPRRPQTVSIVATEVRKHSHAQHFIDRFLEGYGWHGRFYHPSLRLASMYVDQFPENDLSRDRARRHHVKIYPSISEALTLGGDKLAVDGVLIIAEHGDYPRNAKGQKRYPRYKFFKEVIKIFEKSGRSVPVFNDKHLSTHWNECVEMVADSRRLGFAFLAGSSLPVTWRIPSLELPMETPLVESVCVCYGGVDSYDIHGRETAPCMSERRRGGESGVEAVHAVRGDRVYELLERRPRTRRLMFAALARSHQYRVPAGWTSILPLMPWIREACPDPVGYFIEHRDGFTTVLLMLNGLVTDFTYAGMTEDQRILSCQMHLPMPPRQTTTADFFNPLVNNIEKTILQGRATYRVDRTLLTSGMTLFAVESLYRGEVRLKTPELAVAYRANEASTYWRS